MRPNGRELTADELAEEMRSAYTLTPVIVRDGDHTEHPIVHVDVTGSTIELVIEVAPYAEKDEELEELRAIVEALAAGGSKSAIAERARKHLGQSSKVKAGATAA
jgi:hypothetical protein